MANCVHCGQVLPDNAAHCVFCGVAVFQPPGDPRVTGPGGTPAPAFVPGARGPYPPPEQSPVHPSAQAQVRYPSARTAARPAGPAWGTSPWGDTVRTLMMSFGVLLLSCFIAPWRILPNETLFSWSFLAGEAPLSVKLGPIFLVVTGTAAALTGALSISTLTRGLAAICLGIVPLMHNLTVAPSAVRCFSVLGSLLLGTGLVIRSQFRAARSANVLTISGAALLIVAFATHAGTVFSGPVDQLISSVGPPLFALLAIAGMWVASRQYDLTLAWLVLGWPFLSAVLTLPSKSTVVNQLDVILYQPLAITAWTAMVCYGAASVFGPRVAMFGLRTR